MQPVLNHLRQSASYASRHGLLTDKYPARHDNSLRFVGAFDAVMVDAVQAAGSYRDPPTDELVMLVLMSEMGASKFTYDYDKGRSKDTVAIQNFYVQPAGTFCQFELDQPLRFVALSVPNQQVLSIQKNAGLSAIEDFSALQSMVFGDAFLQHSLLRLFDWSAPALQATHKLARESLLLAMIVRLTELAGVGALPILKSDAGLQRWQVLRVLDRLQNDLSTSPSLQELAALVDMSQFHFCRAFKKALGHSPIQYLIALRMERATQLLSQTAMAVADVGAQVGYSDAAYFTRLYRDKTGLLPSAVRRAAA
jgi:AraC family transcriptional regulator